MNLATQTISTPQNDPTLTHRQAVGILLLATLALQLILFREFIFGPSAFVYVDLGSDSYNGEYPLLFMKKHLLQSSRLPGWSFANGLGESLYCVNFEPVSYVSLLAGFSPETTMLLVLCAYTFLNAVVMFQLLSLYQLAPGARIIGALCYAFSGYLMLSGTWCVTFLSPVGFGLIGLHWALEYGWRNRQYAWVSLPIALLAIDQPSNIYFAALIVLGYISMRAFVDFKPFPYIWKQIVSLALYGAIGLGLSSFVLFNYLYTMLQSPRWNTEFSTPGAIQTGFFADVTESVTVVLRAFSPNFLGSVRDYAGYINYFEGPLLYAGLLFVLLIPLAFTQLKRRGLWIFTGALLLFFLIFSIPSLRKIVWLNLGNYYRILNILFVLFMVVTGSIILSGILKKVKVSLKCVWITTAAYLTIILLYAGNADIKEAPHPVVPCALLLLYASLISLRNYISPVRFYVALSTLLAIDLLFAGNQIVNQREVSTKDDLYKKGYYDKSREAIERLNQSDTSFFRIEKNFWSGMGWFYSYNESKVQQYHTSATYNSFANHNYINFLKTFGVIQDDLETSTRFVTGLRNHPILMKLVSTKYFIASKEPAGIAAVGFEKKEDSGPIQIWEDKEYLPLGFCYDQYTTLSAIKGMDFQQRQQLSLNTMIIDDRDTLHFSQYAKAYERSAPQGDIKVLARNARKNVLKIKRFTDNRIDSEITLQQPSILFLSIPYDQGWGFQDGGRPLAHYTAFGGLTALPIGAGKHEITMRYTPPYQQEGLIVSLVSLLIYLTVCYRNGLKSVSKIPHPTI